MHLSSGSMESNTIDARAQSMGYVVLLATTTAISGFLFGFDTAVINGVLLLLRRQFTLSNLQTEVAASSLLLGCLLGAAGASVIGDRYGRRKSLILSAVLFALSSLGAAAAGTITFFSIARLIGGLAIGLASVLTPVYIAEISPSKNRGHSGGLSRQLATVENGRSELEVDARRRGHPRRCVFRRTLRHSRESSLVDRQGSA